jgi:tRNA dimethylallyltransferase
MAEPLRCVCLTAPTASGKTELSLWLAERLPIEIVSMDSAMVYRGMDIGTAKPTPAERALVRHHLIDVADPLERYSAGRFLGEARTAIGDVTARGKLALVVGGTMMYLRALRRGIAALPPADAKIRAAIDAAARSHGWPGLHAQLRAIDAEAAARIDPRDRQRIQRALEVHHATGETLTRLQRRATATPVDEILTIGLVPEDRAAMRTRIAERFARMLAAGFLDEVAVLHRRGDLSADLPALRAVGYRQLWAQLEGTLTLEAATQQAVAATRQLAKRQLTWLRSDPPDVHVAAESPTARETARRAISDVIERWS